MNLSSASSPESVTLSIASSELNSKFPERTSTVKLSMSVSEVESPKKVLADCKFIVCFTPLLPLSITKAADALEPMEF